MSILLISLLACHAPDAPKNPSSTEYPGETGFGYLQATPDDALPAYAPAVTLLAQLYASGEVTVGATAEGEGWVDLDAPDDERHGFRYTVRDVAGVALYSRSTSGPVIVRDFLAAYSELSGIDLLGSLPILGRFAVRVPLLANGATVDLEVRTAPGVYETMGRYDLSLRQADEVSLSEEVSGVSLLHDSGPPETRLDIALVGDGYTEDEQEKWEQDAQRLSDAILAQSPYSNFADRINIRIDIPSAESGVSYDCTDDCRLRDTALGSVFPLAFANQMLGTDYSDRSIFQLDQWSATRVMSAAPWDFVVVIANTAAFGGFGLHYSTVTNAEAQWPDTGVHELSHVLGQLGDEYTGDVCVQSDALGLPSNITDDPRSPPWSVWIDEDTPLPTPDTVDYWGTVGAFSPAYNCDDLYRPSLDCIMGYSESGDFCPVCADAISRRIFQYTDPADRVTVAEEGDGGLRFTVEGVVAGATLSWTLDGEPVDEAALEDNGTILVLAATDVETGSHELLVEARIETELVRMADEDIAEQWSFRLDVSDPG